MRPAARRDRGAARLSPANTLQDLRQALALRDATVSRMQARLKDSERRLATAMVA